MITHLVNPNKVQPQLIQRKEKDKSKQQVTLVTTNTTDDNTTNTNNWPHNTDLTLTVPVEELIKSGILQDGCQSQLQLTTNWNEHEVGNNNNNITLQIDPMLLQMQNQQNNVTLPTAQKSNNTIQLQPISTFSSSNRKQNEIIPSSTEVATSIQKSNDFSLSNQVVLQAVQQVLGNIPFPSSTNNNAQQVVRIQPEENTQGGGGVHHSTIRDTPATSVLLN